MYVFDIETDGLNPTLIHCLSYTHVSSGSSGTLTRYGDIIGFLAAAKTLIGHNIYRYDIPALENILGVKVSAKIVDTLAISWYLYHERNEHGLASWGEDFGVPKPPIEDWVNLTIAEYSHRCEEDVKINLKLWLKAWKDLVRLYDGEVGAWELLDYLNFKMDCAAEQERSRWRLDVGLCTQGVIDLSAELDKKVIELGKCMPRVPVIAKRTKPAKPFKMDGSRSATGVRWCELLKSEGLPEDFEGVVNVITGHKDPNPGSVPQIKDWLYQLGWSPVNFKHVRNKETNEYRKIPQIKNEAGDDVCESIKKLYHKEPSLAVLEGMSILTHRISILKGFLADADDKGYISAQIQGFTNTLRFRHKVVLNLPGVDKPYGHLIRGCLIAPEGYELCGSDMSGLEDRTKQHYMVPHDPEYVKEMMGDDFDPHLDIGITAGMITKEDATLYKAGDKEVKKRLGPVRHDAKQVNYSCTYGITPNGLCRNNGWPMHKAEKLHSIYWKRNWAIQKIAEECVTKTFRGGKWLFNPVSKLWYSLRHEKDRFSTLNQGTGTYCFDMWIKEIRKVRPQLTGQMHDEIILTIKKGNREKCIALLNESIKTVNTTLKLNRDLGVDIQFGNSYADIH